jgi:2-amino-4-hydroxy-6-hydroxymethyldihydropteridine diphosphokinase
MTIAYVGLGANLGDPRRQLQTALQELEALPATRVTAVSSLYRTDPIGNPDQPEFFNQVVAMDTGLAAEQLLENLQEIEQKHSRERPFPNAPRTLDLDLLLYGEKVVATPRLTLPHPRMHERAFVLMPLAEIAPQLALPGRGKVDELLAGCRDQIAERID